MLLIRLLTSSSYDPWFNLSLENYLFSNMLECQCILFLWRNCNAVVIGRAQNPWKECNTRRMERDGIRLVRRSSGGGAVFHDLGNTCFTFMSRKITISKDKNFFMNIVLNALSCLSINAFVDGRNDIVIQTDMKKRKISGSAYRHLKDRKLHHGTLLVNTDLNKLVYYLTPDDKKLESKGIVSVQSRIANLIDYKSDIHHEILCDALQESFFKFCGQRVILEIISPEYFSDNCDFSKIFSQQSSWEWNFGNVPNFTHHLFNRFVSGDVSLYFDIEHGVITRSQIFTDSLFPEPLEELSYKLVNIVYNSKIIQHCCQEWTKKWSHYPELLEISAWLVKSIS